MLGFNENTRGLNPDHRLFAYTATLVAFLVIVTLLIGATTVQQLIAGAICIVIIYFSSKIAIPAEERKQTTIRYSIRALRITAIAVLSTPVIKSTLSEYYPQNEGIQKFFSFYQPEIGIAVLGLVAVAHIILVSSLRDNTTLGRIDVSIRKEFPDLNFLERFEIFYEEIKSHLYVLDSELRWNVQNFVPLDAEVEILNENGRTTKVTDLITALRKAR